MGGERLLLLLRLQRRTMGRGDNRAAHYMGASAHFSSCLPSRIIRAYRQSIGPAIRRVRDDISMARAWVVASRRATQWLLAYPRACLAFCGPPYTVIRYIGKARKSIARRGVCDSLNLAAEQEYKQENKKKESVEWQPSREPIVRDTAREARDQIPKRRKSRLLRLVLDILYTCSCPASMTDRFQSLSRRSCEPIATQSSYV